MESLLDINKPSDTKAIADLCKKLYYASLNAGVNLSVPDAIEPEQIRRMFLHKVDCSIDHTYIDEENAFYANTDVGIVEQPAYFPAHLHTHEHFEIIYVEKGYGINHFENINIELKTGDILFITPGVKHALSMNNDKSQFFNILVKTSTFASSFLTMLKGHDVLSDFFFHALHNTAKSSFLSFSIGSNERISSIVQSIFNEFYSENLHRERLLNALITIFFIELLRQCETNVFCSNNFRDSSFAEATKILEYIVENHKHISLKKLVSEFNYSQRHITRILKSYTGKSFLQLLQYIRVQKATDLLLNTDLSIAEIVVLVGYRNSMGLCRAFKSVHDTTPKDFRKNSQMYSIQ